MPASGPSGGLEARPLFPAGFTLVELMVVLVLIGIMTALIVPEMRGTFEEAVLRRTARKLVSALNLASSQAVSWNQSFQVRLDLANGLYSLEGASISSSETAAPTANARLVAEGQGRWDQRISVTVRDGAEEAPIEGETFSRPNPDTDQLNRIIRFYPDGTADAAVVELRDRSGAGLALRVNPITGRVQIEDLELERRGASDEDVGPGHTLRLARGAGALAGRFNGAFSLVEVLCAVLIMGVGLIGLVRGITTAVSSSKDSEQQTVAAALAAGRIELMRAEGLLSEGATEGEFEAPMDQYRWKETVVAAGVPGLFDVQVAIYHPSSGKELFELRTLLFEPPYESATETPARGE